MRWNDRELQRIFGKRLRHDEPLAKHATFHVGGAADIFVSVQTAEELALAVGAAGAAEIPVRVLGSGANVLPADAGVRGLVIRNVSRQFGMEQQGVWVAVEGGAALPVLARRTARLGLAGLSWACGVPGTVAGGIANNAGCYGYAMSDRLERLRVVHRNGKIEELPASALHFGYRASPFKGQVGRGPEMPVAILGAVFRLELAPAGELMRQIDEWLARRTATQPLDLRSAGSFFKNPPGDYAGRLIEAAGLKGRRVGGAQVSTKHANFFVNVGGARASDLYELAMEVRRVVHERMGVRLELEVELIGAWDQAAYAETVAASEADRPA